MILSSASRPRQAPLKMRSSKAAFRVSKPSHNAFKGTPKQPGTTGILSKPGNAVHPKKTVSISGLFKKPITKEVPRRSHRHKRSVPEHELFLDYQDSVAEARDITIIEATARISESHTKLLSLLANLEERNSAFKASLEEGADLIFSSLDDEKVETSTKTDDGSEIKETVEISKRLAAFKTMVEGKEAEIMECWKEWDDVQKEIVELGVEVLGEDMFVGEKIGRGGKAEVEVMEGEFERVVLALEEEMEGIEEEFVEEMKSSEKEIAIRQKNERNKLLAELLATDD